MNNTPMFMELHTDGVPKLIALNSILQIGDHAIICSNSFSFLRVDESYAEISAILDRFDSIIRKEIVMTEQLNELIKRGVIAPPKVPAEVIGQMLQTDL